MSNHKVKNCIIFQRDQLKVELNVGLDISWDEALKNVEPADPVPVNGNDPLYIIYFWYYRTT